MAYGVIYLITCLLNGKKYVGQTTRSVEIRFREHKRKDSPLGNAIQKYGAKNFTIKILEECKTKQQLNEREIFWVAHFNCMIPNGCNRTGGGGSIIPQGSTKRSEAAAKGWASKSKEERSEIAKKREAQKSPEARSASAKKSAVTRNLNVETHVKMSRAQRQESPYKNLLCEMDKQYISYTALGELLGLSYQTISKKMRGERNFTAKDIAKLVEIFGKPAEYLLERDDE